MNLTLIINVVAVVAVAVATRLVSLYPMCALALGFGAGIAVTVSSRYMVTVQPDHTHLERGGQTARELATSLSEALQKMRSGHPVGHHSSFWKKPTKDED